MGPYCASAGPARGPLKYGEVPGAIGVLEALDGPMPVGMALCVGWDPAGLAVGTLTVHGDELPGRWLVIDGEFRPATDPDRAQPVRPGAWSRISSGAMCGPKGGDRRRSRGRGSGLGRVARPIGAGPRRRRRRPDRPEGRSLATWDDSATCGADAFRSVRPVRL
jgi:hypothetical protein